MKNSFRFKGHKYFRRTFMNEFVQEPHHFATTFKSEFLRCVRLLGIRSKLWLFIFPVFIEMMALPNFRFDLSHYTLFSLTYRYFMWEQRP